MKTAKKPVRKALAASISASAAVDLRVLLRDSAQNKRARAIIKQHRFSAGMTQAEFAVELSKALRGRIAMTTLSGYENGKSGVPGAVLIATSAIAARITDVEQPLSAEERLTQLEDAVLGIRPKRRAAAMADY